MSYVKDLSCSIDFQSLRKRECQSKILYWRRRRRSCNTALRWYACANEQTTSKELTSPMISSSEDDQNLPSSLQDDKSQGRNLLLSFVKGATNVFKADDLGVEIAAIALPALLALTADPLASLVDTAFIGRLGSVELAAVGVSIAVFNLVSKLFNFPVLNLTTSFVAEAATELKNLDGQVPFGNPLTKESPRETIIGYERKVLPAVSTALVVGSALGVLELLILTLGSGPILDIMGVPMSSNMRAPAEQYLALRAIGAPAVVVSLAVQGVFRGFKDTKTPLYATVSGNVINIILVPFLMFSLGYGVSGAAVATVIAEYFMALFLLLKMSEKVVLLPPDLRDLDFSRFLKNGGLLLARSAAVMLSMTLATSQAARQGAIPMAAHQICMQVWLAASLLSDAIALAGQAIIAGALAKGDYDLAEKAAFRTLQMGCAFGLLLSVFLGFGLSNFPNIFTGDPRVLDFLALGIPFVAGTQPINSIAFIFDGIHFGALDFEYAAQSMIVVAFLASGFMLLAASVWGFVGIWVGLTILMALRMLAGILRIGTASGPWKFLK
ncbi:hypothetical protein GOP47_0017513 [Adiantum capillus-veneris]|uniref:Protein DETOXIFICATION n=1 Tax=Adiantum capillus-veneris TaxID=13818 RepID=A0A9D4ZAV0_ADICA|nr:hypothetical protein GOP47_0017513 [Adiantum capillus-veneris]